MNDGDKGGWVELTPEEIERQENSPTRIFYFEDIEECDLRREATESRRRIAEFLEWQYWFNKDVMLLARRIHPEKRASIPNLPALLERIGEHFQHDVLIAKIIKRLDPKHRVRSSTVTRNAMAILTVMELMRSNPGMAKTEAINQAAAELYMTPDNVRKIPEIKNLKLR